MSSDENRRDGKATNSTQRGARSAVEAGFEPPVSHGELLVAKYRIEELIGTGGIGYVMSATNVGLEEKVALKFLRPEFLSNEEAVHRFTNEARLAAKIQHPHVARVLDIESSESTGPFIVMELLVGRDLNQVLHEEGALPTERAVDYVLEACAALSAAHARGIVHRDVKPDNLFLAQQQQGPDIIKILDFGIGKQTLRQGGGRNPALFQTITALGSPSYMAPEQIRAAADIDGRADIWSLGCVLYELLTAHHAFDAPTLMQVCAVVLEREPRALSAHVSGVPAELEAVIRRCLEKSPAARFATVDELALALRPFSSARVVAIDDFDADSTQRLPAPPRLPLSSPNESEELEPASPQSTAPVAFESALSAPTHAPPRSAKRRRDSLALRDTLLYAGLAACVGVVSASLTAPHPKPVAARAVPAAAPVAAPGAPKPATKPLPEAPSAIAASPAVAASPAPKPREKLSAPSPARARVAPQRAFVAPVVAPKHDPILDTSAASVAVARSAEATPSSETETPVATANRLTPSALSGVVRSHTSDVQSCFEKAQLTNEDLKGSVSIMAEIDRDGDVRDVRAATPGVDDATLASCLAGAVKSWRFPAEPAAHPLTSYRLVLE